MATNPSERFEKIFANRTKPELPDPEQIHIVDLESANPDRTAQNLKLSQSDYSAGAILVPADENRGIEASKCSAKPEKFFTEEVGGRESPNNDPHRLSQGTFKLSDHLHHSNEDGVAPSMKYPGDFNADDMNLPGQDIDGNKATGHFCILPLVAKFPYKYMNDQSNQVSRLFFAANKFYDRTWDIYYIQPPRTMYAQTILLLPVEQVQQLLREIGSAFELAVGLPTSPFVMSFFDEKTPQPVSLGRTKSREEFDRLSARIPQTTERHGECPEGASTETRRAFADFRTKFSDALAATKKGKNAKQERKAKERLVATQEASLGLLRAQSYFGLRPHESLWDNQPQLATVLTPLDITKPSPHPFQQEPVIIGFDVEANEHAHHLITEVGVSTLDTKDIVGIPPGPGGKNWVKCIRSRHFRIAEHKHMRNKTYVSGDPEDFKFGESEFVSLRTGRAVAEVDKCFQFPFSAGFQHDGTPDFKKTEHPEPVGSRDRRIILLGHDIQTDIDYLSKMGSKIFRSSSARNKPLTTPHPALTNIEEALDIATLYKALKREENTRSLGSVMYDLGRDAWSLHNGGNDARYTMECLIGLTIKARLQDDAKVKKESVEAALAAKTFNNAPDCGQQTATDPLNPNILPDPATQLEEVTASADAANLKMAATFLDPARTAAVSVPPPGKGRHYGSDNDLDLENDDDADDNDGGVDEASDSEFEM